MYLNLEDEMQRCESGKTMTNATIKHNSHYSLKNATFNHHIGANHTLHLVFTNKPITNLATSILLSRSHE
jgi:hypothetical protein